MVNARNDILRFAALIYKNYHKIPIFYGNHNNLSHFMDSRFDQYMVWMGYWGQAGVKLEGRNPRHFGNIQETKRCGHWSQHRVRSILWY